MCNRKNSMKTGCNCKYICINCLQSIIKYSQFCPNSFLKLKRKEIFYKCTTCLTVFDQDMLKIIKNDKIIQNYKLIYKRNNLI